MKQQPIQQKQDTHANETHAGPESEGKSISPPAFQLMASSHADSPPDQGGESKGGLPSDLVDGFQASTGHDLSNVNVHKNSSKPSEVGALAYAQGNDIHLGAGQEQHLPHEAAHIVQQREGRVKPTTEVAGKPVNADQSLEREADSMAGNLGTKQLKKAPNVTGTSSQGEGSIQRVTDYHALATQLQTELGEMWGYGADVEDVIAIIKQVPWQNGFQLLSNAYNLISPSTPLVQALRSTLSEGDYRQVMEVVTGVGVRDAAGAMAANTTESGYNLRASGSISGAQIGQLVFEAMNVSVTGKSVAGENIFYKIKFSDADYEKVTTGYEVATLAPAMASAKEAWVTGDALGMYLSYDALIAQLQHFDIMTFDKSLIEKISMLRQMSHSSDLPFDEIIGTSGPGYYEDSRPDLHEFYQLMKEGKAVKTPNGEIIDIYHFFVGVEAYQNPRDVASVSQYGFTANSDVGTSDGASTWAGDLGSAAADCLLGTSSEYEKHLADTDNFTQPERVDFYFRSRAPESDLLADIDAWGVYEDVKDGSATTVTELVNNYYGVQRSGAAAFKPKRKKALDGFFARYGLTSRDGTYDTPANQAILTTQIDKFAVSWVQNREGAIWPDYDESMLTALSGAMASRFLIMLQDLAEKNQ